MLVSATHGEERSRDLLTLDVDAPFLGRHLERLEGALLAQPLGLVDELVATVVPRPRVPLRVLVLHHAPQRVQHRLGGEVFRGDEVDEVPLALLLLLFC